MEPITQDVLQKLFANAKHQNEMEQLTEWAILEPQLRSVWSSHLDKFEVKSRAMIHQEVEKEIPKLLKERYSTAEFMIKMCNNKLKNNFVLPSFPDIDTSWKTKYEKQINSLILTMVTERYETWRNRHFPAARFAVLTVNTLDRTVYLKFTVKLQANVFNI
jgi:hypothetical protein